MLAGRLPVAVVTLAVLVGAHAAHAHGIAGNRFFPGTLQLDDPAVADEAIVPLFSTFKHPAEIGDGNVVDNAFNWALFRLLTPKLGIGVDSGWVHRNWGVGRRSGFDITSVDLKGEVYRNDLHEIPRNIAVTHWGLAVEFSTLYLTNRFTPGKLPKQEPLNQFVPLVEFAFDSAP